MRIGNQRVLSRLVCCFHAPCLCKSDEEQLLVGDIQTEQELLWMTLPTADGGEMMTFQVTLVGGIGQSYTSIIGNLKGSSVRMRPIYCPVRFRRASACHGCADDQHGSERID